MKRLTWKQALIILGIVLALVVGTIYYVKYESVLNSLVAFFCYAAGAFSGGYLVYYYLMYLKK